MTSIMVLMLVAILAALASAGVLLLPKPKDGDALAALPAKPHKKLMLGEGIKRLLDTKVIDDRLYDWSQ